MKHTMKKIATLCLALLMANAVSAQQTIKLEKVDMNRGASVMQALSNRQSANEFSDTELSLADLSAVLWAGNGINRPDGRRTAASAMNRQDVDIYVFTDNGVWLYDAAASQLNQVVSGDNRKLFGDRGMSPVILLLVSDLSKFGQAGALEERQMMGCIDAGIVYQNIALFGAANDICTRPRAMMDKAGVKALLKLGDLQLPVLNVPVGYKK